ncbi:MAG: RDD family protein [Candidatus Baltobacteraceae bacterium]
MFRGPHSLRVPREKAMLWTCLLCAPLTIGLVGLLFKSVSVSEFALLVVAGMVYVSISRGRLLGSSVRIHERQFPEVYAIVEETAARLGIAPPQIFARDDVFVPIAAVGTGEPYALIISSQYFEHLRPNELRFLIARELAHIAAGHTRLSSLLSASGRENPAVALVFGAWLRRTEYTADRVGLLCTPNIADAISAISITTFHSLGRRVDMSVLAEQRREIEAEPSLRMGEWISGTPYATNRIAALAAFAGGPLARTWREALGRPRAPLVSDEPPHESGGRVMKRDCAPNYRRAIATAIDLFLVGTILKTASAGVEYKVEPTKAADATNAMRELSLALPASPLQSLAHWLSQHGVSFSFASPSVVAVFGFLVYGTLLVAICGQTLGMMVAELRVVTMGFERVGVARAIWRYALAAAMLSMVPLIPFYFIFRIQAHDRLSRTRLVRNRAIDPRRIRS